MICIYGVRITFVLFTPVPETGCPMWHAGLTLTLMCWRWQHGNGANNYQDGGLDFGDARIPLLDLQFPLVTNPNEM